MEVIRIRAPNVNSRSGPYWSTISQCSCWQLFCV